VQQEFSQVSREVAAARETADPKVLEASRRREAEIREAVDGVSVEAVVQKMSGLGLEVSKALADLSEKMIQEVDRLAAVREAVGLEQKELERLHKIDVAATALDQLVQDYQRQKEQLEAEIGAQRTAWEEEQRATERDRKEQEENLKKQRQREIEEYEYKKALERKKAQDKYDEEMRLLEKKNKEKQDALEKSWQEREAALKEKEEEFVRLKKEAEQFPARLQKAAEEASAQATRAAEVRFEQQILILKKEAEAEKRLAELQIKSLEETISRQAAQIAVLEKQREEARQQVQEIAVRAIEGASGAKALAHVNQIAIEQAKTRASQG
jgi:hypothetical protein